MKLSKNPCKVSVIIRYANLIGNYPLTRDRHEYVAQKRYALLRCCTFGVLLALFFLAFSASPGELCRFIAGTKIN